MSELAKMILIYVLLANVVFLAILNIRAHRRYKNYKTSLKDLESSNEALRDVIRDIDDSCIQKMKEYNKLKKEYDALKEIKEQQEPFKESTIKIARYSVYPETFRAIVQDDISGPESPDQYIVEAIKRQLIDQIYNRGLIDIRRLDVLNDRLDGHKTYCAELKVYAEKGK